MKMRIGVTFLLMICAFALASIAAADGVRKRVKFARGKTSATISGAVVRGDRDIYTIGAKAGQTMRVKIASPERNAVFQIRDAVSGEYLPEAGEADDATDVTSDLPASGDYEIVVGGTRGNAAYRMTVSIK